MHEMPDSRVVGSSRACCRASVPRSIGSDWGHAIRVTGVRVRTSLRTVGEVENKGIVFADIRPVSLVFKRVVEEAETAAHDQFWSGLIGEADARSEVLSASAPAAPIFVGLAERDSILGQQVEEAVTVK